MGTIRVTKDGGKMTKGRQDYTKAWEALDDADYDILIKKVSKSNKRYPFYWDCVMFNILVQAGKFFIFTGGAKIETEEQLHMIMKLKYNPIEVIDVSTGEIVRIPNTTTGISDNDFISKFEQQIIADFSQSPFLVEFPTFEQYQQMHADGSWTTYKTDTRNGARHYGGQTAAQHQ